MKILITIAAHGDETIGKSVANKLAKLRIKSGKLLIETANAEAEKAGRRFIDQDLNRSFPGKSKGNYEERRAFELLPIIRSNDIVIDIHSTTSELKDALIVTRLTKKTQECIEVIQPKYVLRMTATKSNALISNAKTGIAFEYGKDKDAMAIRKTFNGIRNLLLHYGMIESHSRSGAKTARLPKRTLAKKAARFFDVYDTIEKPQGYKLSPSIKNYKLIKKGEAYAKNKAGEKLIAKKDFYPILFGQDNYDGIFGFAGKRI